MTRRIGIAVPACLEFDAAAVLTLFACALSCYPPRLSATCCAVLILRTCSRSCADKRAQDDRMGCNPVRARYHVTSITDMNDAFVGVFA
jgi:hypothetical protein